MAEYINRGTAIAKLTALEVTEPNATMADAKRVLADMPTVDAAPVVRCKDCEYSYDEISYLCCSHGVCVDCEVPPNFSCAYGKRRAENEPPEEGET